MIAGVRVGLAAMRWYRGSGRLADECRQTSDATEISPLDLNPDGLRAASMMVAPQLARPLLPEADVKLLSSQSDAQSVLANAHLEIQPLAPTLPK